MIIGIDPGMKGGISCLSKDGRIIWVKPMPVNTKEINMPGIIELLNRESLHCSMVAIEQCQAMPKQGVCSMFNYGVGYGMLKGLVHGLKLPMMTLKPREWQRLVHQGSKDIGPKERSYVSALELYPTHNFLATPRSTKPHEGMIDAVLIAEACRRLIAQTPAHISLELL